MYICMFGIYVYTFHSLIPSLAFIINRIRNTEIVILICEIKQHITLNTYTLYTTYANKHIIVFIL